MITVLDIYLQYQRETGLSLETVINRAENLDKDYLSWLHNKLISIVSHNQHLLNITQPHLY